MNRTRSDASGHTSDSSCLVLQILHLSSVRPLHLRASDDHHLQSAIRLYLLILVLIFIYGHSKFRPLPPSSLLVSSSMSHRQLSIHLLKSGLPPDIHPDYLRTPISITLVSFFHGSLSHHIAIIRCTQRTLPPKTFQLPAIKTG